MQDKPLLYVHADYRPMMENWPHSEVQKYLQTIQSQLATELPEYRVMVGLVPLTFTIINPKQEFVERLKGSIPPPV